MLKIGSRTFDIIFSELNRKKIESITIWTATIGFVFHLSLVLLNNYSIINIGNESDCPIEKPKSFVRIKI